MATSQDTLCELIATVPTGLEVGAADEFKEAVGRKAETSRGKISCQIASLEELKLVHELRSIDNYCVVVKKFEEFCKEDATVLERLEKLPFDESCDWDTPLSVWRYYQGVLSGKSVDKDKSESQLLDVETTSTACNEPQSLSTTTGYSPGKPVGQSSGKEESITFRVTCTRGGRKHSFSSMEAARCFGGSLNRRFGWTVQLKNFDLEVLLTIMGDALTVAISLNRESKYKRNIVHFGPTTLRSTIAYGLLRMAGIQSGDVVVDPLCGGGSIGIEGILGWPHTYSFNGDIHHLASPRAKANQTALEESMGKGLKMDVFRWDVCYLPLRTASVDVIVSDLPFGKKSGSRMGNWQLYPQTLQEMGRVCRPSTGRAVLLTHDNRALSQVLTRSNLWRRHVTRWINVGGLTAAVYVLHRSSHTLPELQT